MNGRVIGLVGHPGEGKSTFAKRYAIRLKLKQTVCYVRISDDWITVDDVLIFTNFKKFLEYASKQKNTFFIIDEAFTCLPDKLNVKMNNPRDLNNLLADFLVNARKLNNFIFIIFHSLSQIPTKWLIPYLDYLIRFCTQDFIDVQIRRFKSFQNIVRSLMDHPDIEQFKPIILKLR